MRRPVKPFVTEYKGSGRRGKDNRPEGEVEEGKPRAADGKSAGQGPGQGSGQGSGQASGKPSNKSSGRTAGRGGAEARAALPPRGLFRGAEEAEPIDSYEAAMRAADALFSPKSKSGQGSEPAAPPSGRGEAEPPDERQAAAPAPSEPTGRVLRALDEPEPAVPEPMPELAPKRRGRKPGSLNKPKTGIKAPEGARRRLAEPTAALPPDDDRPEDEAAEAAAPPRPAEPAQPRPTPAVAQKHQRDRFPWVRTTLGPGEKWKRRLPKVAW